MYYKNKITLISCYFGQFPWYFPLFIKSCEYNPSIEFLIFSDSTYELFIPDNLKIIPFSLEDFNLIASKKLKINIRINNPYKLCDLKPAYGVVFSEYLQDTDFWGCCDIDLIFGRIRRFLTDRDLNKVDFLSVRKHYPSGFFMLFRNNKKTNHLFAKSKDYKMVFESSIHYCFDECNFVHDLLTKGQNLSNITTEVESFHHVILKESSSGNIRSSFRLFAIEGLPGNLKWNKGFFSYKEEYEVLLYHLIDYKSNIFTSSYIKKPVSDSYYVNKYWINFLSKPNPIKSIYSFYYQWFRPFFIRGIHKIDYLISKKINNYKKVHIKRGTYKFWNTFANIDRSDNGSCSISFVGRNVKYQLRPSILKKNIVYILGKKNIKVEISRNETAPNFNWIDELGNVKKYVLY